MARRAAFRFTKTACSSAASVSRATACRVQSRDCVRENPFQFIPGYDKDEDIALAGQIGFRPASSIQANNVYINGIALALRGEPGTRGESDQRARQCRDRLPDPRRAAAVSLSDRDLRRSAGRNSPADYQRSYSGNPINGQPRLTAAEVASIINFAADRARITRAGIRLPIGTPMQVFITVVNFPNNPTVNPTVLGAFRTGEATLFSWDVAVQKGRTAVGFSSNSLALSTRSVGFLAQSLYPPGLDVQDPGPYYGLQEQFSGLLRSALPQFVVNPAFAPDPRFPNGITIFPGRFSALSQRPVDRRHRDQRRWRGPGRHCGRVWNARFPRALRHSRGPIRFISARDCPTQSFRATRRAIRLPVRLHSSRLLRSSRTSRRAWMRERGTTSSSAASSLPETQQKKVIVRAIGPSLGPSGSRRGARGSRPWNCMTRPAHSSRRMTTGATRNRPRSKRPEFRRRTSWNPRSSERSPRALTPRSRAGRTAGPARRWSKCMT